MSNSRPAFRIDERKGAASQRVASFEERNPPTGLGEFGGGGDAGQSAADYQRRRPGIAAGYFIKGPVSHARAISPSLALLLKLMRS